MLLKLPWSKPGKVFSVAPKLWVMTSPTPWLISDCSAFIISGRPVTPSVSATGVSARTILAQVGLDPDRGRVGGNRWGRTHGRPRETSQRQRGQATGSRESGSATRALSLGLNTGFPSLRKRYPRPRSPQMFRGVRAAPYADHLCTIWIVIPQLTT